MLRTLRGLFRVDEGKPEKGSGMRAGPEAETRVVGHPVASR